MAYKFKYLEKIVGSFIVISILILIGTSILLIRGKNLNPFQKKYFYRTYFEKGKDLSEGMVVTFNSIKIGSVARISLSDDNKIDVIFVVQKEYTNRIKQDCIAKKNAPIIGSKSIEILPGEYDTVVRPNYNMKFSQNSRRGYVISSDSEEGQNLMNTRKSAGTEDIDLVLKNIEQLTASLKDPKGPFLGSLQNVNLISESIADNRENLSETIDSLTKISKNLESITRSLKDNPLFGGKKKSVKSSESKSIDINESYGQYK